MRTIALTAAVLATTALTACGPMDGDPSSYADVLPDSRLEVNLPVELDGARTKDWSEAYLFTARVTSDVNSFVGGMLTSVNAVTELPASWSSEEDNTAVWGPFADALDPVETLLVVQYMPATDEYEWAISQRPKELSHDESAWVGLILGHVDAGATEADSSGWMIIDFTAANQLDPNQTATGSFGVVYDIDPDGVTAEAGFEDFSDGGEVMDAYYRYGQVVDGEGYMDLVWTEDVHEGPAGDETLALRSRWLPTGEGRADAVVFDGDLSEPGTLTDCWDEAFEVSYYSESWSSDQDRGEQSACAFDEAEWNEEHAPDPID
jgi:hypothetical protein